MGDNIHTCGVFSGAPGKRNQEGDYFWEEILTYDKQSCLFFLEEQPYFIASENAETMLGNIYGGDEEQENAAIFYEDSHEVFQFSFSTGEPTTPKLTLSKFQNQLPPELTGETLDSSCAQYSFIGLEFWELKVPNTVALADSKLNNLLSKSNHAKAPFSYYRHAPIHIFPANISIDKFMNLLGVKGTCFAHNRPIPPVTLLAQLEPDTTDFTVDLDIQTSD